VHSWSIFCVRTNHGQTQIHKINHDPKLGEATAFPLIVYIVAGHGTNIQMAFCPKILQWECHNPNLRLVTEARGCKVAGQEKDLRVTSHAPRNAKKVMNPHTPKWTPIVGVGVSNGLPNLQSAMAGVKTHQLEEFSISLENYWRVDV
jgi:hypothetical protein